MNQESNPRQAGASALKQAQTAARRGDSAAAEKWSKAAERMAATAEKLAALPAPESDYEEEERLRAELRARLARYVEAANQQSAWEEQERAAQEAIRNGAATPPPLPPAPYSDADLERIVRAEPS